MTKTLDLTARLEQLRDEYTYRVNTLLGEDREDLATDLADQYVEEVAWELADSTRPQSVQRS